MDLDYYGLRDDEDGVLIELEAEAEARALEYTEVERRRTETERRGEMGDEDWLSIIAEKESSDDFVFGSATPVQSLTVKDIQQAALEAKRREALAMFGLSSS